MCGSCSNENAIKTAFMWYMKNKRNGAPISSEDLTSCMEQKEPGTPKLSVLTFEGSFHGRTLGMLTCTHSKAIHKVDVPAFNWPVAPFPRYRYPLEKWEEYNWNQDRYCIKEVHRLIDQWSVDQPVAAVLVEPIQAEGGDHHGSRKFFRNLRDLCTQRGIAFIVDEVQTGGGVTGDFWAHHSWKLTTPPDIVTFAKKFITGGYYLRKEFKVDEGYRIYNTWMGDPSKLIILKAVIEVIKENNLVSKASEVGKVLLSGLEDLQKFNPKILKNARGMGTFCAIDCLSSEIRDKILGRALNNGLHIGGCGDTAIRFRPALIFTKDHCDIMLQLLEKSIKEVDKEI